MIISYKSDWQLIDQNNHELCIANYIAHISMPEPILERHAYVYNIETTGGVQLMSGRFENSMHYGTIEVKQQVEALLLAYHEDIESIKNG